MKSYPDLAKVNSSEAYNGDLLFVGEQVVIPVINLGLLPGHLLNTQSREQLFVNRSYLRFTCVHSLTCEYDALAALAREPHEPGEVYDFGAFNLYYPHERDFRIVYTTGELLLLPNSRLSATHWVPTPTPRLRQNMADSQVHSFLRPTVGTLPELPKTIC
ncbi:MAG: hypothetical protein EOO61_13010 [Hymenobacter sp.]|nr:MAG: hypothetical protein EOO61_13010 [Hymenobacter sp.]